MASSLASTYGRKLAPTRRTKTPFGFKGRRSVVEVTHNPSTINPGELLLVRFPTLSRGHVVVPGSTKLLFDATITSTDVNARFVSNLGRALVEKLSVRFQGREVVSTSDAGIYNCYRDLWLTPEQRADKALQGIDDSAAQNLQKLRSGAADASAGGPGSAQNAALGTTFEIPLDFELLSERGPFHPSSLGDRLEYEITFAESPQVIIDATAAGTYAVSNIRLEYETVVSQQLASEISQDLSGRFSVLYERVHRHRRYTRDNADTEWVIDVNVSARSLRGIVILAHQSQAYARQSERFLPIAATKVEAIIEGVPNEIYSTAMKPRHFWHEARRLFAGSHKKDSAESNAVSEELALSFINPGTYYVDKFALCLDMRSTSDNHLHGSGRALKNTGEGVVIRISRTAGAAENVELCVFLLQDAQLNFSEGGRLVDAIW